MTTEMNLTLTCLISDSEIEDAVFEMGGLKAPGPEGFQGIFYHCYWDVISQEIKGIFNDFMDGEVSPKKLNSTQLVLIPKVSNPESIAQFRPISLCNFSYMVLSKILANQLKPLLPTLISPM